MGLGTPALGCDLGYDHSPWDVTWDRPQSPGCDLGDDHTPWDLDLEAYNQILTATKKLAVLPRISHMSLYSVRRNLEIAGNEGASWIKEHLIKV